MTFKEFIEKNNLNNNVLSNQNSLNNSMKESISNKISEEDLIKILENENCPEWVINHSIAVYKKAVELSRTYISKSKFQNNNLRNKLNNNESNNSNNNSNNSDTLGMNFNEDIKSIDMDLIRIGAILHDIGRSKSNNIDHGIIGGKIAIKYGFDDKIVKIIERHIGSGIYKEEAKSLNLPEKDYIPISLEEKIVSLADNLHNGSDEVDIQFTINKWKKRVKNPKSAINNLKKQYNEIVL
ncbi:MAG: HDIG domain-containing protein [Methanobrevibacter sp.]|nr:HDIG domain-containing protein [Candidatus Methanoflexus mossambicus]